MTQLKAFSTAKQFVQPHKQPVNNKGIDPNFQTPPQVCRYMASLVPEGTRTVLEPTPGLGNLVKALKNYEVTAPEDYFLLDASLRFDCVVMNPPFSSRWGFLQNAPNELKAAGMRLGYQILLQCMEKSDNVIALMPWFTISDSDVRLRRFKKYGLKSITGLPRKTFAYTRIQTIVLELHKGWEDPTLFHTFDYKNDDNENQSQLNFSQNGT